MQEEQQELNDSYEQLRQWYLARLRQVAQEEASRTMATPASRIASDQKAIRQLAESAANPDPASGPQPSSKLPRLLLTVWLGLQALFFCIFCLRENSVQLGLNCFVDLTFSSLLPRSNSTPIDDLTDKLCFLSFFAAPAIMLLCTPSSYIDFAGSPQATKLKIWLPKAATICFGLIFLILLFLPGSNSVAPQALSLMKETVEGPERSFLAWLCILLFIPCLNLKYNQSFGEKAAKKIGLINNAINPTSAKTEAIEKELDELETSVKELLQRERAIADYSKTVILCMDKGMNIEAISMSCLAQWGYHQHELLGQSLECIMLQEDFGNFGTAVSSSAGSLEQYSRIRKGDNSIMDGHWFIEWSSKLQKYFATCDDITDRMNLERARTDYIAQLTHDMRSPLGGVSMNLEMIGEMYTDLPAKLLASISLSKRALARVLQLITDILDAEKLRHSQRTLTLQRVDLIHISQSALDEIQNTAAEKSVRLSLKAKSEKIFVRADPALLMRVLANLISNALSFSPENAELKIELAQNSDSAIIKIIDQGPGIHKDYHRAIFERFGAQKVSGSYDRQSTGIGLSICRDIVTAHGGLIGVESSPGQGSTFWFTLALERRSQDRAES